MFPLHRSSLAFAARDPRELRASLVHLHRPAYASGMAYRPAFVGAIGARGFALAPLVVILGACDLLLPPGEPPPLPESVNNAALGEPVSSQVYEADPADKDWPVPLDLDSAETLLTITTHFGGTCVGPGCDPTIRVAAFNLLLDQPDAVERFRRIERSATKAGRLFALAAWQLLDRNAYDRLASELRDDTSMIVEQERGCTPHARACGDLVQDIEEYSTGTAYRAARADAFFLYMEPRPPPVHRISGKDPTYPRQALELGIGGTAHLTASLRADGTVEAVESSGQWLILNDAAAQAVRSWRFEPISGFPNLRVFATFEFTPETEGQHWAISCRYVSYVVHSRGDSRKP